MVQPAGASPADATLPVVAAVNGTAAGAGSSLALACDIALAGRSASFLQAFVKIGLMPDAGGTWLLPKRLGLARALGLATTGGKLGAEEAQRCGLNWEAVDDALLQESGMALAQHLAAQPTRAFAAIKRSMYESATNTLDAQLDLERDLQRDLGRSTDYAEGVSAFLEGRVPRFAGV